MDISQRQQRVGAIWGVLAFAAGVATAWWVVGDGGSTDRFQHAVWLYLSAHYKSIGPIGADVIWQSYPRLGLVTDGNQGRIWYVIPVLTVALAGGGVNISLGHTRNWKYMVENGAMVLIGYLPAALIGVVWSDAAPSLGWFIILVVGAFLALAVGSSAVGSATQGTPVLGVTSLWGLAGIGVILLLGGYLVIRLLLPVAAFAAIGIAVGTGVVYLARTQI